MMKWRDFLAGILFAVVAFGASMGVMVGVAWVLDNCL